MHFERQRVLLTLLDALGGQSAQFFGGYAPHFDCVPGEASRLGFVCVGNVPGLQSPVNQGFLN